MPNKSIQTEYCFENQAFVYVFDHFSVENRNGTPTLRPLMDLLFAVFSLECIPREYRGPAVLRHSFITIMMINFHVCGFLTLRAFKFSAMALFFFALDLYISHYQFTCRNQLFDACTITTTFIWSTAVVLYLFCSVDP